MLEIRSNKLAGFSVIKTIGECASIDGTAPPQGTTKCRVIVD
jgi:hypothetical protein